MDVTPGRGFGHRHGIRGAGAGPCNAGRMRRRGSWTVVVRTSDHAYAYAYIDAAVAEMYSLSPSPGSWGKLVYKHNLIFLHTQIYKY